MLADFAGKKSRVVEMLIKQLRFREFSTLSLCFGIRMENSTNKKSFPLNIRLWITFQILMSASIISETWHEAQLEETKMESKIDEFPSFHYCVKSNRSPDRLDVFIRLELEAKSVLAELLSCAKKTRSVCARNRATTDDSMIWSFSSLYFHSETTAKRFLAKLAACVSARGHKDRYFSELAPNTITRTF